MDKKLQRIVGVLLVLALATVLSPLFFNKNDVSRAPAIAMATPSSSATPAGVGTPTASSLPVAKPALVVAEAPVIEKGEAVPQAASIVDQKPIATPVADDDIVIPSVISTDPEEEGLPLAENNMSLLSNTPAPNSEHVAEQDNLEMIKKSPATVPTPQKVPRLTHAPNKVPVQAKIAVNKPEKNIENLKKIAWAIKLGSFKNKINAVNLTNKLRAAGYHAFTREVTSKSGSFRIVYIGPESERASALNLSKKVAQQVKIQGIIVNYQPLAL